MGKLNQKYSTHYGEIDDRQRSLDLQMRRSQILKLMQILIRVAIIAVMVILFFSGCTKKSNDAPGDGRRCWTCTRITLQQTTQGNTTTTDVDTVCNKTQAEIQALEESNTYTKKYGGGVSVIVNESCQ